MTVSDNRAALPMAGHTHGNRSPVTCHLRCADACFKPVPNQSTDETFHSIASRALSRRSAMTGAFVLSVAAATTLTPESAEAAGSNLPFNPIGATPDDVDAVRVPGGYRWQPVIKWGDPLFSGVPALSARGTTPAAQARQFGYNCDYLDIMPDKGSTTRGILVANHEYTNEDIMFPPGTDARFMARTALAAHGMSVVEISRSGAGAAWKPVRDGRRNRRITGTTPFTMSGPAAGSPLLRTAADPKGRRVHGTLNNCAGGTTPWGTILSGEENWNQYFLCAGTSEKEERYGLGPDGDERMWRSVDPRFDATRPGYRNEPNRFGWIVEVDPEDPASTPVKHTALGRIKHEAASVAIDKATGKVVVYTGDDERFEYLYKFISRRHYDDSGTAAAREHNKKLLNDGDLFVARFTGDGRQDGVCDGTGVWIPLTMGGKSMVPGMSLDEVLVYTRLAASKMKATPMDRPEDVQVSPMSGRVYMACTNNSKRGLPGEPGTDEANPRPENKDGHVVEITEMDGEHTSRRFTWLLFLICGDKDSAGTYFGGYTGPVSPIACPDNLAFDSRGNLWISTDGQPSAIGLDDALHCVETAGTYRGRVRQFLSVPAGAETCGPVIHDKDGSVFVAVQHPGEDGSWEAPQSHFPDYGKGVFKGPRPAVIQVTRA
ncbi:PhoX family protein [Nostocoides australiense]|nr:PhoX family phosphatase [Tetrasphaera sp.]HPF80873.1 PhoX family phosphatase [Tetrasphaera australiensis]HRW01262.1 PhoX family phosphatase [Tetrasphaera sp.]